MFEEEPLISMENGEEALRDPRGDEVRRFQAALTPFQLTLAGGRPPIQDYFLKAIKDYRPGYKPFTVTAENLTIRVRTPPVDESAGTLASLFVKPVKRVTKLMLGLTRWREDRVLLDGIDLILRPGEMTLILGVPGAGASLLLEMISHRTGTLELDEGDILFNGVPLHKKHAARDIAYVRQRDVHSPLLTVAESLDFAVNCQMPASVPLEKHRERRDVIMDVLGLAHRANAIVGNQQLRGISGGEKRRLSVGLEMGRFPGLYLLDEPTSGLDVSAAFRVCHAFQGISASGPPVLAALKQPPFEVVALFNYILVLSPLGAVSFYGTVGEGLDHFLSIGFRCPLFVNPTDFFLDVQLYPEKYATDSKYSKVDFHYFADRYRESLFHKRVLDNILDIKREREALENNRLEMNRRKIQGIAGKIPLVNKMMESRKASNLNDESRMIPLDEFDAIQSARAPMPSHEHGVENVDPLQPLGVEPRRKLKQTGRPAPTAHSEEEVEEDLDVDDDEVEDGDRVEELDLGRVHSDDATSTDDVEEVQAEGMGMSDLRLSKHVVIRDDHHEEGGETGSGGKTSDEESGDVRPLTLKDKLEARAKMSVVKVMKKGSNYMHRKEDHPYFNEPEYPNGIFRQIVLAFGRGWKIFQRSRQLFFLKAFRALAAAFIISTLFWQLGRSQQDARNMAGFLFFVTTFYLFSAMSSLATVFEEREVLYRDKDAKFMSTLPYMVSSMLVTIPIVITEVLIFGIFSYFGVMLNFRDDGWRFAFYMMTTFILSLVSEGVVRFVCSISPSLEFALGITPTFLVILFVYSGNMIVRSKMPVFLVWIYWANPVSYGYIALMQNMFAGAGLYCKDDELVPPSAVPTLWEPYPFGFSGNQKCQYPTGGDILASYDIDDDDGARFAFAFALLTYYIFFMLLTFVCLSFITYRHKQKPSRLPVESRTIVQRVVSRVTDKVTHEARVRVLGEPGDPAELLRQEYPDAQPPIPKFLTDVSIRRVRALQTLKEMKPSGGVLSWSDLCYTVTVGKLPIRKKKLHLLNHIDGYVRPGMALALMGASGAGKTTLLDVLAQRKTTGKWTGDIWLNGAPLPNNFHRYMGYVEQTDVHEGSTTVYEAVAFAAITRLAMGPIPVYSIARKLEFVQVVLDALNLTGIQHRIVGHNAEDGLSPEERKRLTLAVELAANPSILFLDEPTTGLDTVGAATIVEAIESIAHSGRSIVCTVHQPSKQVFASFTHLLLLVPGGRTAYFGPIHDSQEERDFGPILRFFGDRGFRCPPLVNPADFMLSVITDGYVSLAGKNEEGSSVKSLTMEDLKAHVNWTTGKEEQKKQRRLIRLRDARSPKFRAESATFWHDVYMNSQSPAVRVVAKYDRDDLKEHGVKISTISGSRPTWGIIQLAALLIRAARMRWRSPGIVYGQWIAGLIIGFVLGITFLQADHSQLGLQSRVGLLFMAILYSVFGAVAAIAMVMDERALFFRERLAGSYGYTSYLIKLIAVKVPFDFIAAFCVIVPLYFLAGLRLDAGSFFYLVMLAFLSTILSVSFAQLCAIVSPNQGVAIGLLTLVLQISMIFAGFFIRRGQVPDYWIWAPWVSFMAYPLEAALVNELRGQEFYCSDGEAVSIQVGEYTKDFCPITTGDAFLEFLDLDNPVSLYRNPLVTIGFIAVFMCLLVVAIRAVKQVKR